MAFTTTSTTTTTTTTSTPRHCRYNSIRVISRCLFKTTSTSLHSSNDADDVDANSNNNINENNNNDSNNDMQTYGKNLIIQAAIDGGATEKMISIDWKTNDRIIVTIDIHADEDYYHFGDDDGVDDYFAMLSELEEGEFDADGELFDLEDFDDEEFDDGEDYDDEEFDDDEDEDDYDDEEGIDDEDLQQPKRVDLTLIARNINERLSLDGENSMGDRIAQLHEIEVTTPEFDNVLRGQVMFESYKGFDVIVEHYEDPKKKAKKSKKKGGKSGKEVVAEANNDDEGGEDVMEEKKLIISEGKLVGRDIEKNVTMVNIKGRIVKIKNDLIENVKLPKAKREKGAK